MPPVVEAVAKREGLDPAKLSNLIASGTVVIPRNARREIEPMGVGELLNTKVNVNIGTSQALDDPEVEVEKALAAVESGADTIMDLSTGGDLTYLRRKILATAGVPVGTVPIYQAAVEKSWTPRASSMHWKSRPRMAWTSLSSCRRKQKLPGALKERSEGHGWRAVADPSP